MKTIQINEITPDLLSHENEPLAIEDQGHLLGYFYPVSHQSENQDLSKDWEKLDKLIDQASQESQLDPDSLLDLLDPSKPFFSSLKFTLS